MRLISFLFLTFSVLLISCENPSNGQSVPNDHHDHDHNQEINLNKGQKWHVEENMMIYIRKMEEQVASFETSQEKDYQILAGDLEENLDLLTSNCTMSGKAHDELHKWLVPYMKLVEELSASDNPTESAKIYKKINHSFKDFNNYFN